MATLFENGRIVDLILLILIAEALVFCVMAWIWRDRVDAPPRLRALLFNLAAGGCLLMALRAVMTGADWRFAGAWLGAALVAHLADLYQRFRGS
ncbi:MAG: hypothetical protein V2J10_04095 [Wenzhouxiangella sp.]|jgi:hypothetical protein|nr:hypothetical protein [Wenzhouxiangella sp.]